MKCIECGKTMKRTEDKHESYECECGNAVRRLTVERSNLFVKMTMR